MHKSITQYNVTFKDGPAMRSRLRRLLSRERVDLDDAASASADGRASIQFLAEKDDELKQKLEKTGADVREDQVFQVELPNDGSVLPKLARSLADSGINILSLYTEEEEDRMRLILAVDEPANAVAAIEKMGLRPDYAVFQLGSR